MGLFVSFRKKKTAEPTPEYKEMESLLNGIVGTQDNLQKSRTKKQQV